MLAKNMRKLFKSSFFRSSLTAERRRDAKPRWSEMARKKKVDNSFVFWRFINEFVSSEVSNPGFRFNRFFFGYFLVTSK
jgi:hypothetical protein